MPIQIDSTVMLPGYAPYPRFGRVAKAADEAHVVVSNIECGDPRCAAEHMHGDGVWSVAQLEAAQAYQPRAGWERGRKSSPNSPVTD